MSSLSEKIIKPKIGLLQLAKQLGNVSKACDVMGYSRDTPEFVTYAKKTL